MPPPIDHGFLRLAVVPLDKKEARGLSESLQEEIRATVETSALGLKHRFPRLEIVERSRIDTAIRELEFQASGKVRDDNFVGMGRMLGADHVLTYGVTVDFTGDVRRTPEEATRNTTEFGLIGYGGIIRAFAYGKVIQVETGTVVFQQTSTQSAMFPRPPNNSSWTMQDLGTTQRWLVSQTIVGLFAALDTALAPSPDGTAIESQKGGDGVRVNFVLIHSPAYNAGLRRGDIITAVDGVAVRGLGDPVLRDLDMIPSELHHYTIQRNGQEQTLAVRPRNRQSAERLSPQRPPEKYQRPPSRP